MVDSKPEKIVRTRFAPSPTGHLHVGGARTALFSWLLAKKSGGQFILRIEDTDTVRSKREFEESIVEDLLWLGLKFDEGPYIVTEGDNHGPYRQSERFHLHYEYSQKLLENNKAYYCYCSPERLKALRKMQVERGVAPGYDRKCLFLQASDAPKNVKPVIRFKVPEKKVTFIDGLRGESPFDASLISDFIIMGSDDIASFLFASALDDALMEITDVIRGDDHISNTPRQILLLEALGLSVPSYTHIPLILGPDRKPLSKRERSGSITTLRNDGYLAKAIINTIARLGWAPGEGLKTLEELTKEFEITRLSKSASVFDAKRLSGYNKAAMSEANAEELLIALEPYFRKADKVWLATAVNLVKDEAETAKVIVRLLSPLMGVMTMNFDAQKELENSSAQNVVTKLLIEVESAPDLTHSVCDKIIKDLKEKTGLKGKPLMMPMRAALTGCTTGIDLRKVLLLLGKANATERIKTSLHIVGVEL